LLLAGLYRGGLALHNVRLRLPGSIRRIATPVVSVGNLTVGGTGKTPMVAWVAKKAQDLGARPIIVSRGYRAEAGQPSDEALELAGLCPDIPHLQNSDRRRAIREWTARRPCGLAILDDGFQHRQLARALDIVLVDALHPFGYRAGRQPHVLPRGLMREPLSALGRADFLVLTRTDLAAASDLAALRSTLGPFLRPGTPFLMARHRPAALVLADGSRRPVAELQGQAVAAACGIGNPEAFRRTLEGLGARVAQWHAFPDHHAYTAADLDGLVQAAEAAGLKRLVTTGKDSVKWRALLSGKGAPPSVEVSALEVEMQIVEGADTLRDRIAALATA
jgi:tetraacyldisaccharide 4'-kinase